MKGIVKAISEQNNAVCITGDEVFNSEEWFDLAPQVKMAYIKKGSSCEFKAVESQEEGNRIITFCKCEAGAKVMPTGIGTFPAKQGFQKPFKKEFDATDEPTQRMSAVKAASLVYEGTGNVEGFKTLSEEVAKWIQTGIWMTTEKV